MTYKTKTCIGIVDYRSGNTQSVVNAISHLGYEYIRCSSEKDLNKSSHIILPGVGSFAACMDGLKDLSLIDALHKNVKINKKPFLGICVGMQILMDVGTEFGTNTGLGWLCGSCDKISFDKEKTYLLPHVGWNVVINEEINPIFNGISDSPTFYFVHSYVVNLTEKIDAVSHVNYGTRLVAAVQKDNIFGVQFHPEKSQRDGLLLLKNFCELI